MKDLRLQEVMRLAQGHTADLRGDENPNFFFFTPSTRPSLCVGMHVHILTYRGVELSPFRLRIDRISISSLLGPWWEGVLPAQAQPSKGSCSRFSGRAGLRVLGDGGNSQPGVDWRPEWTELGRYGFMCHRGKGPKLQSGS